MGRISLALDHQKNAQVQHDLLFEDTLKDYLDLLTSIGINPESLKFYNKRTEFSYYYELFLKEPNLNWDVKDYTIPTLSKALEVIRDHPEKYSILKGLEKNFTVLMGALVKSRPANLLLPMMVSEWKDPQRIKVLIARASLISMILNTHMDLKFYRQCLYLKE